MTVKFKNGVVIKNVYAVDFDGEFCETRKGERTTFHGTKIEEITED